jgi:exopolysaccharide biosynthesis protein
MLALIPMGLALLAGAAPLSHTAKKQSTSVTMLGTYSAGVPLRIIEVDLKDLNVKVTGQITKFSGHTESFQQMIRRSQPTVAITGTFFCNRSKLPVGDMVIGGQLAHFGGVGTALCITEDNEIAFIQPEHYTHQDWSQYDFVLCSGPRLVKDGTAYVDPWAEGFKDKHMMNRNSRVAIGVTKDKRVLLVTTRDKVYLSKFAKALKGIGCENAINLDGGSSLGVYYKGSVVVKPSRPLTNLILVYQDRGRYETVRDKLLPVRLQTATK